MEISDGVLVLTSRTMHTTSTVLYEGGDAVVVDPAWHADELSALADLLAARGLAVRLGWATHAHHDHVLWHPRLGRAPRLASPAAAREADTRRTEIRTALDLPAELLALAGLLEPHDGGRLPWRGPRAEILVHDAHAAGHSALWLPGPRVLIAGDMLSDVEIPLLETSTPEQYRAGLDLLAPYVEQAEALIPGHGTLARAGTADSPVSRLAADRRYLNRAGGDDPRLRAAPDWLHEAHAQNLRRLP
ncbi:MBL fold metallo-hydrolase [Ruania suaedae]|uniref:MBL fold metallo-hydrolase n=1 Tax=Ruania suaedae TaxID=2897774 RepID=UPI001E615574|nr:MBL fold metallo-hydrolase [Ruania suaedae]UFU02656.1 MBL fold metallo-hydrolase [Ruania suaedae]